MQELETNSTALDTNDHSLAVGNGAPALSETVEDDSIAGVLEAEFKSIKAETEKNTEKLEKTEKPAEAPKAKAEGETETEPKVAEKVKAESGEEPDKAGEDETKPARRYTPEEMQREEEKRKYSVVAQKFTPEARAKWDNVPHPVKAEMFRIEQEREAEVQNYRQSHERYEQLKQFDEAARNNGRDLRDTLATITNFENLMRTNPAAGLELALRESGPRRQDGTPLTLYEVAQYIVQQGPQAAQQMTRAPMQQQTQQPQIDPAKLEADIESRLERKWAAQSAVQQFAAARLDFEQLAPAIKTILDSGAIDSLYGGGLTHEQKLAEAYRMAGGSGPTSIQTNAVTEAHSEPIARPVNPDAGTKSVRGAPANGVDAASDETETDLRDLLKKEMKKLSA